MLLRRHGAAAAAPATRPRLLQLGVCDCVVVVCLLLLCDGAHAFGGEADSLNRRATYLDGKVGSHVVLNCPLDFPQDDPIPYVLRWFKDVSFRSAMRGLRNIIHRIEIVRVLTQYKNVYGHKTCDVCVCA